MGNDRYDFPDKKDFFYIVTFLIVGMIFVSSFRLADDTTVIDYIGFAGTLMSIILAVLAIIYAFYQSSTYETATHKLDTSANEIKKATDKLSNISEIERIMDEYKDDVTRIKKSVEMMNGVVGKVSADISSVIATQEATQENIKNFFSNSGQSGTNSENSHTNHSESFDFFTEEYLQTVITNIPQITLINLILVNKFAQKGVDYPVQDWVRLYYAKVGVNVDEEEVTFYTNIQISAIMTFSHMGLYNASIKNQVNKTAIRVSDFNATLTEILQRKEAEFFPDSGFSKILKEADEYLT